MFPGSQMAFLRTKLVLFLGLLASILFTTKADAQCNFTNGPEGELCSSAIYICGSELDGYMGKLPDKLSVSQQWLGLCNGNGTADNIIWFSFTVCSKKVCLEIIPSNCSTVNGTYSGIQAGLFTECSRSGSVACTDPSTNNGMTSPVTLCYDNFTPGQIAYFFVDGYAKSVCDFQIRVIEGIDTTKVQSPVGVLLEDGAITGPDKIACADKLKPVTYNLTPPGDTVVYSSLCKLPNGIDPSDSICYVWKVFPADGREFVGADSTGRSTQLLFTKPGRYTLSADAYFHPFFGGSCANAATGAILSWVVDVAGPDTISLGTEFVCPGLSVDFCGNQISSAGVYCCKSSDCEVLKKEFVFGTSKKNEIGEVRLCSGESFVFQGVSYTQQGVYSVLDNVDCALLHTFEIVPYTIQFTIAAPVKELTCEIPSLTLTASGTSSASPDFQWTNAQGITLGSQSTLVVQEGGQYFLQASIQGSQSTCQSLETVFISENKKLPSISATLPVIGCNGRKNTAPKPFIAISSPDNIRFVKWTLPDGRTENTWQLAVDSVITSAGKPFLLEITGSNGCILDTSFVVPTNFQKPTISLQGDDLTCYSPMDTLVLSSTMLLDSIRWSRSSPKVVFYNSYGKDYLPVDMEGTYKVEVMAKVNSCWNQDSIVIENLIAYPPLVLESLVKWHCNTDSLVILPATDKGDFVKYTWSTLDGKIKSSSDSLAMVASSPGFYFLKVFNEENGCESNGVLQIENELNVPQRILFEQVPIKCHGERNGELQITGTEGGFGPYTYQFGEQNVNGLGVNGIGPGIYELLVADKYACVHSVPVTFVEPPLLDAYALQSDWRTEFDDVVDLDVLVNFPDVDIRSYIWTNSEGNVVYTGDANYTFNAVKDDVFLVTITTEKGCVDTVSFRLKVNTNLSVQLPNIFSPNGDGVNDVFLFAKNKIPATIDQWMIYDRWGNLVFTQSGVNANDAEGWDGSFDGQPLQSGVYILVLNLTDYQGRTQQLRRDVTLIR
jgi:gliding motility-associated-like protein